MRYQAIESQSLSYPVHLLCQVLSVSSSGYYAWCNRLESHRTIANRQLVSAMSAIHQRVYFSYGSPRMHAELVSQGFSCGVNRVARLMREHGLIARRVLRFRSLTKAGKREPTAPNIVNRQFMVGKPNRIWVSDITYIPTGEGHLYLAVILDLYNRQVVGWSMTSRLGSDLVTSALSQAVKHRSIKKGLIHHSDRDGLYSCSAYKHLLSFHAMIRSMSRKGNCYDNACMESFFSTLKKDIIYGRRFKTREEAKLAIIEYIETFYNCHRLHSTLGNMSPMEYERQYYYREEVA